VALHLDDGRGHPCDGEQGLQLLAGEVADACGACPASLERLYRRPRPTSRGCRTGGVRREADVQDYERAARGSGGRWPRRQVTRTRPRLERREDDWMRQGPVRKDRKRGNRSSEPFFLTSRST
jgi:hypothetical protein